MTGSLPVTVAATRRARPGREADLHRWAETLAATAATFPGHVAAGLRQRRSKAGAEVTVALTFATAAAASTWAAGSAGSCWIRPKTSPSAPPSRRR